MTSAAKDFDNDFPITWCPAGCGNFAILSCLKQALAELNYKPHSGGSLSRESGRPVKPPIISGAIF